MPEVAGVDVTDGEKFFRINYIGPTDHIKRLGLPVNVYAEAEEAPVKLRSFEDARKLAKKNPEVTFNLIERLAVMNTEQKNFSRNIVTENRLQRIFDAYLEDERKAFRLLREAEKDFKHKLGREKVWRTLWEAPTEVNGLGYIIPAGEEIPQHPERLYLVTSDGVVYLLASRWATADTREEVFRLVKNGQVPRSLPEVSKLEVLKEIAKKLAPLDPALVNVVMP